LLLTSKNAFIYRDVFNRVTHGFKSGASWKALEGRDAPEVLLLHISTTYIDMNPDNKTINSVLAAYSFVPNSGQCDQIRAYITLLLRWNQKISLTTVIKPVEILKFHFGESLYAISSVPVQRGRLADVGSGAGFPGLALALTLPSLSVSLIESNAKKAAFLSEVVRELGLHRVHVLHDRMENVSLRSCAPDFVTARAVGHHDDLVSWAAVNLAPRGNVVMWLGEEELARVSSSRHFAWHDPAQIPGSKARFILTGCRR
jgi:16S rRNA (guanine527-N7)-methyltransferase